MAFCGHSPSRNVDLDGDDFVVLNRSTGATVYVPEVDLERTNRLDLVVVNRFSEVSDRVAAARWDLMVYQERREAGYVRDNVGA